MAYLAATVFLTLAFAALCRAAESAAGAAPAETGAARRKSGSGGEGLEKISAPAPETAGAASILRAAVAVFGSAAAGVQFAALFGAGPGAVCVFSAAMALAFAAFAEILPGILAPFFRPSLRLRLRRPFDWLAYAVSPLSKLAGKLSGSGGDAGRLRDTGDDEIILLAEKGQKDGLITPQERDLIANSLSLDDVAISEIMTPRTVVMALDKDMTVERVFSENPNLNFSRIPVYSDTIDNIVGIVRRRDILTAVAGDKGETKISDFMQAPIFVPENGSALSVMRQLIKRHQQMGIVVDEFASLTGVVTLEDIFEHLLGSEIFEADDIAVDMRELARTRKSKK